MPKGILSRFGIGVSADMQNQLDAMKKENAALKASVDAVQETGKQILAVCKELGREDMAANLIVSGKSVEDARNEVQAAKKANCEETAITGSVNVDANDVDMRGFLLGVVDNYNAATGR